MANLQAARALVFNPAKWMGTKFRFGGYTATMEEIPDLLALARKLGLRVPEGLQSDMEAMVPPPNWHCLGEILDRRETLRESNGFLGTGAGTYWVKEVLVRLDQDWEDYSGDIVVSCHAGEEVWMDA